MGGDYIADYSAIKSLERDVILHVVELAGRFLGRRGGFLGRLCAREGPRGGLARRGPPEGAADQLARAGPGPEQLHGVGDHLRGVAAVAPLVLPLARADAPLD